MEKQTEITLVQEILKILSKHNIHPIGLDLVFEFKSGDFNELPFAFTSPPDFQNSDGLITSGKNQNIGWGIQIYNMKS